MTTVHETTAIYAQAIMRRDATIKELVAALDNLNHLMTRYDCPFGKPLTDKSDCTCNYHGARIQARAVLAKVSSHPAAGSPYSGRRMSEAA